MPNLNKVMLMGNLTRDPELRFTPNNTAVANIGLAVNRRWRNQQGENQEETTFVDCEAWGRTAEVLNQYLKKGRPVYIEGRLRLDQWQDKEGNNRSKLKIVVESFEFLDSGGRGGGDDSSGDGGRANYGDNGGSGRGDSDRGSRSTRAPQQADGGHHPIDEDDIPF